MAGGAAIGAQRILKALKKKNIETKMLVQNKESSFDYVETTGQNFVKKQINFGYFAAERFFFMFKEKDSSVRFAFSPANFGEDISKHKLVKEADIIHINWINFGFLSLKSLKKLLETNKPIVWTQHDMWAFTGGCHYSHECNNFIKKCGNCFYLKNPKADDLSNKIWRKKNKIFKNRNLNIVSVSSWLKENAEKSTLFKDKKHIVIHNSIDEIFEPIDKKIARKSLGIEDDKIVFLFGSDKIDNPIKGFKYFIDALIKLSQNNKIKKENVLVFMFGRIKNEENLGLYQIPFEYKHFGFISDKQKLVELYSASTITIASSMYEAFGQVIAESMACKTPVVAFDNTGPTDIIRHKEDGYLAKFQSSEDIYNGILWILFEADYQNISEKARISIKEKFSAEIIAEKYINLYKNILK